MSETEVKTRTVKSKCMAYMFVWLGFEYEKAKDGYIFKRDGRFDRVWADVHELKQYYRG